jgi:hypothetical protein
MAPLLETLISWRIFDEDPQVREASIGRKQAVVVLNPTKYTVEGEGDDECGSINEDLPSKEEIATEHVLPQLSLAYKEQEDSSEE